MLSYNEAYLIFLPITKFLSFIIPNIIDSGVTIVQNSLVIGEKYFTLIPACIALPAYYLLFFLILTTKDLSFKKSLTLFFTGSFLILLMNVIRIDILILAFSGLGKSWFEYIHLFLWKFVSGVYVALVWIYLIKKYNIKEIPVYSDFKYLYSKSLFKKRTK